MTARTVVVTGAADGIGRVIAHRLAAEGDALVLVDIDAERLATAEREMAEAGAASVETSRCDLSAASDVTALGERLAEAAPYGLVNVAGIGIPAPFLDLSLAAWERTFAINLVAPFLLSQALGRAMVRLGRGRIVNIASVAGKEGYGGLADYCASKAALISLTQATADALGGAEVTVNAVCPGSIWTAQTRGASGIAPDDPDMEAHRARFDAAAGANRLRRPTVADDIAATVSFLLSENARQITAQSLNVDGGRMVH